MGIDKVFKVGDKTITCITVPADESVEIPMKSDEEYLRDFDMVGATKIIHLSADFESSINDVTEFRFDSEDIKAMNLPPGEHKIEFELELESGEILTLPGVLTIPAPDA